MKGLWQAWDHDAHAPEPLGRRRRPAAGLAERWPISCAARSSSAARNFRSAANTEHESSEAQVAWLLDRLRSIGLKQAVAVDLTRPEFGIPVARIVVPGLEGSDHHHAQYAPGPRAGTVEGRGP